MIRRARPGEAAILQGIVERAYAHYPDIIGRRPAPMDDDYEARIADGEAWLREQPDGRIDAVLILEQAADHLWLDNIAVEPGAQHSGGGRALMLFVAEEALRRGLPEVRLLTNEKMERNIIFYRRLGFAELDRREEDGFRRVFFGIAATALAQSAK